MNPIIFTDLDGTLLEKKSYSYIQALPTIRLLQERNIPLIFCSSKTYAEQKFYQEQIGIDEPCIVENGSAIHFPSGWTGTLETVVLGTSRDVLHPIFQKAADLAGCSWMSFEDLTFHEIASLTGLSDGFVDRLMLKRYSMTLVKLEPAHTYTELAKMLESEGLRISKGTRFYTVTGKVDKGVAVKKLLEIYQKGGHPFQSMAVGDGYNDIPMLKAVDHPYLVQKAEGLWIDYQAENLYRVPFLSTMGFNAAVHRYLGIPYP